MQFLPQELSSHLEQAKTYETQIKDLEKQINSKTNMFSRMYNKLCAFFGSDRQAAISSFETNRLYKQLNDINNNAIENFRVIDQALDEGIPEGDIAATKEALKNFEKLFKTTSTIAQRLIEKGEVPESKETTWVVEDDGKLTGKSSREAVKVDEKAKMLDIDQVQILKDQSDRFVNNCQERISKGLRMKISW